MKMSRRHLLIIRLTEELLLMLSPLIRTKCLTRGGPLTFKELRLGLPYLLRLMTMILTKNKSKVELETLIFSSKTKSLLMSSHFNAP
jgi:hypothetical protein